MIRGKSCFSNANRREAHISKLVGGEGCILLNEIATVRVFFASEETLDKMSYLSSNKF